MKQLHSSSAARAKAVMEKERETDQMASNRLNGRRKTKESTQDQNGQGSAVQAAIAEASIQAASSGEWLPAEELHERILNALGAAGEHGVDLTVDVGGVDHLDASALQILLALATGQKQKGRLLRLLSPSETLCRWFEYAGATEHLPLS